MIRIKPVSSAGALNPSAKDTFITLSDPNAIPRPSVTKGPARSGDSPSSADSATRDTAETAAEDREARIINYQNENYQDGYHVQ